MKLSFNSALATPTSLLLVFPAAYFIGIIFLKHVLHVESPYEASILLLERLGINESPGLNINGLMLFGTAMGILMNITQVLSIEKHFTDNHFHFYVHIKRKWFPLTVILLSAVLFTVLLCYF